MQGNHVQILPPLPVEIIIEANVRDLYPEAGPKPATAGSAAFDLVCPQDTMVKAGAVVAISTGIRFHCPIPNIASLVLPRSGLGAKKGIILGNTIGLIDNDYQGDVTCFMWNRTDTDVVLKRGDRFAQVMFIMYLTPQFIVTEEFTMDTERGANGFGSTDVQAITGGFPPSSLEGAQQ